MTRRLLPAGTAFLTACAAGSRGTSTAAPAINPAAGAISPAAAAEAPAPHRADAVRYGPSALRYVVHRQVPIQQTLCDRPQSQDVVARIFVAAAINGPAHRIRYPTTVVVDSILADSRTT